MSAKSDLKISIFLDLFSSLSRSICFVTSLQISFGKSLLALRFPTNCKYITFLQYRSSSTMVQFRTRSHKQLIMYFSQSLNSHFLYPCQTFLRTCVNVYFEIFPCRHVSNFKQLSSKQPDSSSFFMFYAPKLTKYETASLFSSIGILSFFLSAGQRVVRCLHRLTIIGCFEAKSFSHFLRFNHFIIHVNISVSKIFWFQERDMLWFYAAADLYIRYHGIASSGLLDCSIF